MNIISVIGIIWLVFYIVLLLVRYERRKENENTMD